LINDFGLGSIHQLLFTDSPKTILVVQCFFTLFIVSSIISWITVNTSISHLGNKKKDVFIFLLCVQIFTPILGNLIVFISIYFLKRYNKIVYPVEISTFQKPVYFRRDPVQVFAYAEGWASVRLELSQLLTPFSENERKQALITLGRGTKKNVNHIYTQLVSDDMEEIRICAFSLLEVQQNLLHDKINELLKIYQKSNTERKKAFYAKHLALQYWELIYLNLGEKEFRKIILEKSKYYAKIAHQILPNDPFLLILLARIAIATSQTNTGINLLLSAAKLHAPNSKIYPYLAENSYIQRDFKSVKKYLSKDTSFRKILKIGQVVEFWC
jgi:hypothetical protein